MAQFEMDTFAKSHDHMSNFWNACYDAMMSSSQRREQEKAASCKMFQVLPAPRPWDVTLGMCSSSWGTCCSPQGRHPGDMLLTLETLILGMCSSSWRCHSGEIFLTVGTLSSGCAPHPGDIVLGRCSSSQGYHPGDVLIIPGMSFQGCAPCPGYMFLSLRTSPRGYAPCSGDVIPGTWSSPWGLESWRHALHPRDVILGTCSLPWGHCSSSWGHHPQNVLLTLSTSSWRYSPCPGDVTPWTCSSLCGCPQALLPLHSSAPLAGAGAGAGGEALQGGKHPARQRAEASQQPPQHRAEAVAVPVPPPHLAPLRLGRPVSPLLWSPGRSGIAGGPRRASPPPAPQEPTRGSLEAVERRDLLPDEAEAGAQLEFRPTLGGQRPTGQLG